MNRSSIAAALTAALVLASGARAQTPAADRDTVPVIHVPPIVVTATRGETPSEEVASAITVVTHEEIERRQHRTVLDALRHVPGVAVARNGGPGGVGSVFLRGADSDHTLVLVDGVEASDPSTPAGAYDFADFLAHDVERIEILRGPQSPLYGSSATGGVVHVLTRRGDGPAHGSLTAETGSFGTRQVTASAAGGTGAAGWSASLTHRTVDGISASAPRLGGREDDATAATAFSARLDWHPRSALDLTLLVRARTMETDLDQGGFAGGDDPNFVSDRDEVLARAEGRLAAWEGRWTQRLAISFARHDRRTVDEPDPARPQDRSEGSFDGGKTKLEWLHALRTAMGRLTVGLETEVETAETRFESESVFGPFSSVLPEEESRTTGVFAQHEMEVADRVVVAIGGRVDDHERFGAVATWRVAPVLRFPASGTRLRATWGTGFKAPTLFQLFDPEFGARDLDPEESAGWDVGIDQDLADGRVRLGATWFSTEFDDQIAFEFPDGFRNLEAASTRGLETTLSAWPTDRVRVTAAYTFTDTEDESGGEDDGEPLLRRPRHAGDVGVGWDFGRGDGTLAVRRVGERDDLDFSSFPAERVSLDAYTTVRAAASVRVGGRYRVFGRVENLLDAEYEEVLGFGAPGRAFYGGVRVEF